ncbi:hypothetical protein [Streptomyces sp. CLCI03]
MDLDHCLDESGQPLPWAQRLLDLAPSTWVEVSLSGDGLHVWGFGSLERGRRLPVGGGTVEVYGDGRFIAVTGRSFVDAPSRLAGMQPLLDSLGM